MSLRSTQTAQLLSTFYSVRAEKPDRRIDHVSLMAVRPAQSAVKYIASWFSIFEAHSAFFLRGSYPLTGLHLLSPQEPVHLDALVRQLALEGRRLSRRHRHVLQRTQQPDGPSWRRSRRHGQRSSPVLIWGQRHCEAAEQPVASDKGSKINSGAQRR